MLDPITIEVLRCKLEAIADDGARTIRRTAISPVLAAGDCSCAIYDAGGGLVMGGGDVVSHFHTGVNGVEAILAIHGDTVAEGDIFLVNDPYQGGGFHAQDVFIHQPVFAEGRLVGWVGASGHMMDMGGSLLGSFVPDATECYQEALRLPPVRVYRKGEEQLDIWAILRTNIRMSTLVEMDMRALISGTSVVRSQLEALVGAFGREQFTAGLGQLCDMTEAATRRRIGLIEPGEYRAESWCEWDDELFRIPCTVRIGDGKLTFDFMEACPQTKHYFNSKPYVVASYLGVLLSEYLADDLPINEGLFRTFELQCRPGSILDAQPPAPIGGPHLYACQAAIEAASFAFNMALAASPEAYGRSRLSGPSAHSGYPLHTVACLGLRGQPDGFLLLDSTSAGGSAGFDRDCTDMALSPIGRANAGSMVDIEVLESWYPIAVEWRGPRRDTGGAGAFRAGAGISMAYRMAGTDQASVALMSSRQQVPIQGHAGGLPGSRTRFAIRGADASEREVSGNQQGIVFGGDEAFVFEAACGGGWGDPLERDPALVEADVRRGRMSAEDARTIHGVIVGDPEQTRRTREAMLAERLAQATPARRPLAWSDALRRQAEGLIAPLYIGIEQHGRVAVSARSGAPLALSPDSWADGCPTLRISARPDSEVALVAYLDPATGHYLIVDVVGAAVERSFDMKPDRWAA